MSDKNHITEQKYRAKMLFNNDKGKKKRNHQWQRTVQDENKNIISTGSSWKLKLKENAMGCVVWN